MFPGDSAHPEQRHAGHFPGSQLGARTIAFGTHVTPMPVQTMEAFPTLDYALRGEPELTLRELIDTLEHRPFLEEHLGKLFREHDPGWEPRPEKKAWTRSRGWSGGMAIARPA